MARAQHVHDQISVDEYLMGELTAEVRHELVDGIAYAMAGTTVRHDDIVVNLIAWLRVHRRQECSVSSGNVKLRIETKSDTVFFYPDVFVTCTPRDPGAHVLRDAALVFEVLSESTERIDRGEKFHAYTTLPMLQDYVLVAQDMMHVEVFRRRTGWQRETYKTGDDISLDAIDDALPITDVYRDVQL